MGGVVLRDRRRHVGARLRMAAARGRPEDAYQSRTHMIRPKLLILGAATFLAAHAVENGWSHWFYGVYAPWFLNSSRAVAFTAASLMAIGAIVALASADRRTWLLAGLNLAA